jgi:tRNA-2-methylthio-N6-dimethylallyladenosine synthase
LALSSDFIVGFPGESAKDFAATMALVEEVGYAQAFSFKYSPRPGTPAAEGTQVSEAEKSGRLGELQALLNHQQKAFNESLVGRELPVLFEKISKQDGQLTGRSPYLQPVHVTLPVTAIGKILPVEITRAHANSLSGVATSLPV